MSEEADEKVEDPVVKATREGNFYGLADHTLLISKTRTRIPVDIIGSPVRDDRDNIIGIIVVFYDIMERKSIEEALNRSLKRVNPKEARLS